MNFSIHRVPFRIKDFDLELKGNKFFLYDWKELDMVFSSAVNK